LTDVLIIIDDGNGGSTLVLFPHPNMNDPNDPLRWPTWRKHVAFASVCAFTFLTNYAIGGLAPAFYPLSLQFNKTQAETSQLLIYPILVLVSSLQVSDLEYTDKSRVSSTSFGCPSASEYL